jgi:hypothetical protein
MLALRPRSGRLGVKFVLSPRLSLGFCRPVGYNRIYPPATLVAH